jgi:outer membrane receptor protein involved in Fe transport
MKSNLRAGAVHHRGSPANLTARWSTFFGYTFLDSEVVKSNTPAEVGSELTNTPEHSASLWTTYRVRQGLEVGAGAQYVDERLNNLATRRYAPDYLLFDAMASYDFNQRFTLRLNFNNLTDERYIDRVGGGHFRVGGWARHGRAPVGAGQGQPAAPRGRSGGARAGADGAGRWLPIQKRLVEGLFYRVKPPAALPESSMRMPIRRAVFTGLGTYSE